MQDYLNNHLLSKTNGGFILLLAVIVSLSLAGKLETNTVEAIKWLGLSFFGVRTVANLPGNKPNA